MENDYSPCCGLQGKEANEYMLLQTDLEEVHARRDRHVTKGGVSYIHRCQIRLALRTHNVRRLFVKI